MTDTYYKDYQETVQSTPAHNDSFHMDFKDTKGSPLLGKAPTDKGRIIEYVYLIYGISILLPWNVVLTGMPYFSAQVTY